MVQGRQPGDEQEKSLGQRIYAARKKRKWSREKLAEEVGVVSLSIYRWETGKAFPRGDEIQLALIEVLGLPKDEFTRQREKMMKKDKALSSTQEGEKNEALLPATVIPLPQHVHVPALSEKELSESEIVEYKIPPTIVYRGFYERVFHEKYGDTLERRVTSNGKKLLPYETWVNADTVTFGWGYTGSGPRHLAESMLLDYYETMYPEEEEDVLRSWVRKYSGSFKMDFVAWFDKKEWEIWSGAITVWLKEQKEDSDGFIIAHEITDAERDWVGWSKIWDIYKGT